MKEIIHIGFSKSASTFLQATFSSGRDINYIYKSGRFSIIENSAVDLALSDSQINIESDEHIVLPEWHPNLHRVRVTRLEALEKTFTRIQEVSPGSKIVLVLRNQYSMIVSRYSQYVVGSGGTMSFEDFVTQMIGDGSKGNYFENYYYKIVVRLEELFGRENVLVMFYEEIARSWEQALEQICSFTGYQFENRPPNFKSQRKGLSKPGLQRLTGLNRILVSNHQPVINRVKTQVPKPMYNGVIRAARLLDSWNGNNKIVLDDRMMKTLSQLFHEDNSSLSEHFDRDLVQLGYL